MRAATACRSAKFAVTPEGVKALRASRKALLELWSGLDEILSES